MAAPEENAGLLASTGEVARSACSSRKSDPVGDEADPADGKALTQAVNHRNERDAIGSLAGKVISSA
jgi:hypothetical protein